MRNCWLRPAGLVLACLSASATAAASHELDVGASVQSGTAAAGNQASVAWLGRFDSTTVYGGIDRTVLDGGSWTLLEVGATRRRNSQLAFSGGVDVGPAMIGGERLTFEKVRVDAAFSLQRWTLTVGDTYVDVAPSAGHLLGTGVAWRGDDGLLVQTQLTTSVGGNLDEHGVVLRADWRRRHPYVLGGIAAGRTNNRLALNVPAAAATRDLRELFVGVVFPIGSRDLTLTADDATVGDLRRRDLSVTLRWPLGRKD